MSFEEVCQAMILGSKRNVNGYRREVTLKYVEELKEYAEGLGITVCLEKDGANGSYFYAFYSWDV